MPAPPRSPPPPHPVLSLSETLKGRRLLVVGATGFVGKVLLAALLTRFPQLAQLWLMVRPERELSAEARMTRELCTNPVFGKLRQAHGDHFDSFIRSKVRVVPGDVTSPRCGVDHALLAELQGNVDAIVNVSGLVDFRPPLDRSFEVNVSGVAHLVALAEDLGGVSLLHTSTCYVSGRRSGVIAESHPLGSPPPLAQPNEPSTFDAKAEQEACADEIAKIRRESLSSASARRALIAAGLRRAHAWGFPNTYTYTKYLGEQLLAASSLRFAIVRPSIVESTLRFPFPGWNEGMNTSAPIIYAIREGVLQVPGSRHPLDVIPCDLVASGMVLALGELLTGSAKSVYQLGSSDSNPASSKAFFKLAARYKQRYQARNHTGGRWHRLFHSAVGVAVLSHREFERLGPGAQAAWGRRLHQGLRRLTQRWSPRGLGSALAVLERFCCRQERLAALMGAFAPFTTESPCLFRSDHVRMAHARLLPEEKQLAPWDPETIDWVDWFHRIHTPALERWVFPQMDARARRAEGSHPLPKNTEGPAASLPVQLDAPPVGMNAR